MTAVGALPVGRRPVPLTAGAWHRLWVGYVAGGVLVDCVLVGLAPGGHRVAAIAALLGLLGWVGVFGRDTWYGRRVDRCSGGLVAGVTVLFAVAVVAAPAAGFALAALYPLIFMSLSLRAGIAAAATVSAVPAAVVRLTEGVGGADLPPAVVGSVLGLVFGVLIGTTVSRMADRSEELARLLAESRGSREALARMAHEAGTNAERARLAGEIHDTLAQGFHAVVALTRIADDEHPAAARHRLDLIAATAREHLAEARAMVTTLTPPALATDSLAAAVRDQAARLAEQTGIAVTVSAAELSRRADAAAAAALWRAAQETLANVRKHANAGRVTVRLAETPRALRLTVTVADDGVGFDPRQPSAGLGLLGMRARAERLGGRVTVHSGPGRGTTVCVEVPA